MRGEVKIETKEERDNDIGWSTKALFAIEYVENPLFYLRWLFKL